MSCPSLTFNLSRQVRIYGFIGYLVYRRNTIWYYTIIIYEFTKVTIFQDDIQVNLYRINKLEYHFNCHHLYT